MKKYLVTLFVTVGLAQGVSGQGGLGNPQKVSNPSAIAVSLAKRIEGLSQTVVSREMRQESYSKLLEGQRHLWIARRTRWSLNRVNRQRLALAKNALTKAVEINPTLAEGYTALADLEWNQEIQNFEDILLFSQIAIKLDRDNFGAHRYSAVIYTLKSKLNRADFDSDIAKKAVVSWMEVGRLDLRNAGAWAFLSAFYKVSKQTDKRIDALRKWLSAVKPLDLERRVYASVMQQDGNLSPSAAAVRLGEVLLEVGKNSEAQEVLTRAVAESPRDGKAIALLTQVLATAKKESLASPIEALRQAVFANPGNRSLVELLAQTLARTGRIDDAIRVLRTAVGRSLEKNRLSASNLQVAVGDIFAQSNRVDEAISAYRRALEIRGITSDRRILDDNKDFAIRVISKMVRTLKKVNRENEAELLIRNFTPLFGGDDVQLGRLKINLLLEIGKHRAALSEVRLARKKSPREISFLRLEASILTKLGEIDDGVSLILDLVKKKPLSKEIRSHLDDFANYLFISSLYIEANRKREAFNFVRKALDVADTKEKRQIARLNLAFTQQAFGEFEAAEINLRKILNETPNYPIALNNLGYLLIERNKMLEEAVTLIKKAVRMEPENSSYLDSLGWAFFKLGKLNQAEDYLKKAFRYNSSSATILEHLGDVFSKRGRNSEAKEVWKQALTLISDNEDSDRLRNKLSR